MVDYEALGARVKDYRRKCGKTQSEMAAIVGVSQSFYGHIERGTRKASIETIIQLANAFGVTADALLMDSLKVLGDYDEIKKIRKLLVRDVTRVISDNLDSWITKSLSEILAEQGEE